LVIMAHSSHSAATDDDLVAALQAVTTLSVCLPERVIVPALHVGMTHRSRTVRAAAADSVTRLFTGIQATLDLSGSAGDDQRAHGLYAQLANELMELGVLLLLVKSVRDVPNSKAVVSTLQPFFDDYTKQYLIASLSFLAQQQLHDCRALLKAGAHAAARRNESTAALLAWSHTQSAKWATSVCPALSPSLVTSVLFPCAFEGSKQLPGSADPCLENHIAYLQCNTHAQSVTRLSPGDASASCQSQESSARRCDYAHDGLCGWDGASSPPFSVIKRARTRSGPILYHAHDLYFRVALELYGEWAAGEVEWCLRFLPPGGTFIDAGAHVGTISLAVARQLGPSSTVIAFEATRFFASLAQANAVVAGLTNMRVIHAALSNSTDCLMARADHTYTKIQNMGGQAVMHCPERVRRACADRSCAVHGETLSDGTYTYEWCKCPHYQCAHREQCSLFIFVGIHLM
jgi:FkbM family methyltransferase